MKTCLLFSSRTTHAQSKFNCYLFMSRSIAELKYTHVTSTSRHFWHCVVTMIAPAHPTHAQKTDHCCGTVSVASLGFELIYEMFHILNCGFEVSCDLRSYERNLRNCVTSRYRCDALTNWAMTMSMSVASRCHGFKPRWSSDFFSGFYTQLLKLRSWLRRS